MHAKCYQVNNNIFVFYFYGCFCGTSDLRFFFLLL